MQIEVNGKSHNVKKGMKLLLLNGKIVTTTSHEPWTSIGGITKLKVEDNGEIITIKELEIKEVVTTQPNISQPVNKGIDQKDYDMIHNRIEKIIKNMDTLDINDDNRNEDVDFDNYDIDIEREIIDEEDNSINFQEYDNISNTAETGKAKKELVKNNVIKPKFSLIPQLALLEVAKVFTAGESKYGAYNYSKGEDVTTYIDAAFRHINTFLTCEDYDDETKTNHLANAISNLMMTLDNILINKSNDNRNSAYKK